MDSANAFHVLDAPIAQRRHCFFQRDTKAGQRILDARRYLVERLTVNNLIRRHFPQLLDEHFFANSFYQPFEFPKTPSPGMQMPQDQYLPLAADHVQGRFQSTIVHFRWMFAIQFTNLQVSTQLQSRYLSV